MQKKTLLINSVRTVPLDETGADSVPTIIRYCPDMPTRIGYTALEEPLGHGAVNEDFKIGLGRISRRNALSSRATVDCGDGERRSAYNIAADFFAAVCERAKGHLDSNSLVFGKQVLVSEPLSFYASNDSDWLETYRANIRRILDSKFEGVQFLPEPFAVYQYYRYGVRHSLVAQDRKHCALIIDFGGGTFDVSVIETTNTGDIKKSGKHARPLGAHSKAVGGFEINRQVASILARQYYCESIEKGQLDRGIRNYFRWREGELDIEDLSSDNQRFLKWFGQFIREVELVKLKISRQITNWSLTAPLGQALSITVPENPFGDTLQRSSIRFTAESLREIFIREIWERRLKACVRSALDHARRELDGRPLDLVLLSGGSANFRWLEGLLSRDFETELKHAAMVSLRESYQEVVAKGLAIECARRGYEPNSEFSDVTYNPVFLVLDPDGRGDQVKKFRLVDGPPGLKVHDTPGQILASAESLDVREDGLDLVWKVRLDCPPKQFLKYYFLRGTVEVEDVENRYNIVETSLPTQPGTKFASSIRVSLHVAPDGTCEPAFTYNAGARDADLRREVGVPFCIDLVSADQRVNREAFLGIDFGSATSAVSYVDWEQIDTFDARSQESVWLYLNELIDLPAPVAIPLKSYLGATRAEDSARYAIDALEAMLAFSSFICWADTVTTATRVPKIFNQNWKRSAGPLKKMLTDLCRSDSKGTIVSEFRNVLSDQVISDLDQAISGLDREKHHKNPPGTCDPRPVMERLGNACRSALLGYHFGHFENVRQEGFGRRFAGNFRIADGSPPFHRVIPYAGTASFSEEEAFLVNFETGRILALTPLIIWRRQAPEIAWQDCMLFDGLSRSGQPEYKRAGSDACIQIDQSGFPDLYAVVDELLANKFCPCEVSGVSFQATDDVDN